MTVLIFPLPEEVKGVIDEDLYAAWGSVGAKEEKLILREFLYITTLHYYSDLLLYIRTLHYYSTLLICSTTLH